MFHVHNYKLFEMIRVANWSNKNRDKFINRFSSICHEDSQIVYSSCTFSNIHYSILYTYIHLLFYFDIYFDIFLMKKI